MQSVNGPDFGHYFGAELLSVGQWGHGPHEEGGVVIDFKLNVEVMGNARFAFSPLAETISSLHVFFPLPSGKLDIDDH